MGQGQSKSIKAIWGKAKGRDLDAKTLKLNDLQDKPL
jgi:hypothetical protein